MRKPARTGSNRRFELEVLENRQLMSAVPNPLPAGSVKLAGSLLGTVGSYRNQGNTIANALDGNAATFVDAASASGAWVGMDLGTASTITQVQFVPRSGFSSRMVGGVFQGSNTADFSAGVTTLFTITRSPTANVYSSAAVNNGGTFRYVRYMGPANGSDNVAEIEFDGTSIVATSVPSMPTGLVGKGTASNDVTLNWANDPASIVTSYTIERQGPGDAGFLPIASTSGPVTFFDDLTVSASTTYSYEIVANNGLGSSVVSQGVSVTTPKASVVPMVLTGSVIGTSGSYKNQGNVAAKVFDGNANTYFDAPTAGGSWVGLDLGSPQAISQISYIPRNGFASRMVGGLFQASNTADFSSGVVTLYTVLAAPSGKGYTTQNVITNGGFRYVRYLSPATGECNVAEIQFTGLPAAVVPINPNFVSSITWANGAPSPIVRAEAVGGMVNGIVYVFGGFNNQGSDTTSIPLQSECDSYNPATNTWTRLKDFPEPFTHSQEVVVGTQIWFVGGYIGNHPGPGTTHVWVYDTTNDSWSRGPDLPQARGAGAAALVGNTIYFAGGMDQTRTIDENSVYALDLTNQAAGWQQMADLPNGRNHVAAASLGGYFYVIGGQHGQEDGQAAQSEVDRYDPSTNTWTQVASLPLLAGKSHITEATLVYEGRIIVVGGETGYDDPQQYIVDYDPVTDSWSELGMLPAARSTAIVGISNRQIVVTTGNDPDASTTTWIGTLS